jgi:ParB family chromosome partitioning protein
MLIPIMDILPNPEQPRTIFDQAELEGLAQSIKENGLIQPIVVEKAGSGYILIDGERINLQGWIRSRQ